jgi:hypothetical protein
MDASDRPRRYRRLESPSEYIQQRSAHQAVRVAEVNLVGVNQHIPANANVSGLLSDVRPAATETNDPDLRRGQNALALRAQKFLPNQPAHAGLHFIMAAPTATKSLISTDAEARLSQI